jgi:hypothetical protein
MRSFASFRLVASRVASAWRSRRELRLSLAIHPAQPSPKMPASSSGRTEGILIEAPQATTTSARVISQMGRLLRGHHRAARTTVRMIQLRRDSPGMNEA